MHAIMFAAHGVDTSDEEPNDAIHLLILRRTVPHRLTPKLAFENGQVGPPV